MKKIRLGMILLILLCIPTIVNAHRGNYHNYNRNEWETCCKETVQTNCTGPIANNAYKERYTNHYRNRNNRNIRSINIGTRFYYLRSTILILSALGAIGYIIYKKRNLKK